MDLRIAARQSDLARLQAYQVGDQLEKKTICKVTYQFRESLGDKNQDDPLWKMPEKGVFTEDFREGLKLGQWDIVVHSWKDLPVEPLTETEIVATLPRADSRDLFLFKKKNLLKKKTAPILRVFSSSPRRIYNGASFLLNYFPLPLEQVQFEDVRGNILTRIEKMMAHDHIDGLMVAKAAIDRLLSAGRKEFAEGQKTLQNHLEQCLWQVLPLSVHPTAAAQGALAIEIAKDRKDLKEIFQSLNCKNTWESVHHERKTLKAYGGGCHQKIGVSHLKRDYGDTTFLRGVSESGEVLNKTSFSESPIQLKNPCPLVPIFFERQAIAYTRPPSFTAHYVARSSALPEKESFGPDQILWCSGLKTWKSLAARGYWVSGCSDSLGEEQDSSLGPLVAGRKWLKWTHEGGHAGADKKKVATYSLQPKSNLPDLSSYDEFYWMSGSQFKLALERFPKILGARHFCGPGHTFTIISEVLQANQIHQKPTILPSFSVWLDATT